MSGLAELLGVLRTAKAQAARLIEGSEDGADRAQTRRDLPMTLDVATYALENLRAWFDYDQARDVFVIDGKQYARALFGAGGFGGQPDTLFRIVETGATVTVETVRQAAAQAPAPGADLPSLTGRFAITRNRDGRIVMEGSNACEVRWGNDPKRVRLYDTREQAERSMELLCDEDDKARVIEAKLATAELEQFVSALDAIAYRVGDCEEWAATRDPQVVVSMVKDYMAGVEASATQAPAVAPVTLTGEHIDGIKQALLDTAKDPFDIEEADRIVDRIVSSFKPPVQPTASSAAAPGASADGCSEAPGDSSPML